MVDDQGEGEEREEHHVELLKACEDAAKAFQAAEEPLHLVAPFVEEESVMHASRAPGKDENDRSSYTLFATVGREIDHSLVPSGR